MYILEVQRFNTNLDYLGSFNRNCEHVGYMDKVFRTKQEACDYYDKHNPQMRSLNALGDWVSDWDPATRLLYIVRRSYREILTIPPFPEITSK